MTTIAQALTTGCTAALPRDHRIAGRTGRWRSWPALVARPGVALSAAFLLVLALAALWPAALTGTDPLRTDPYHPFGIPDWSHPLGTDENGRDVWARLVYGARPSLVMGVLAALITTTSGIAIGLVAGLSPRAVDTAIARGLDLLQCLPEILLVLLIVSFWGGGPVTLLVGLSIVGVPLRARQVRAQAQLLRRAPFVEAAYTLGLPTWRVVLRHVLPNAIRPVLVLFPLEIGWKIATVAALSFLGLGAPPPAPLWGSMLALDRDYILNGWWLTAIPALLITLTVIAVNTMGSALIPARSVTRRRR